MSRPCVLVVEPDIVTRHPLSEYLRECGCKVIEAFDADEARQLLAGVTITIAVVMVAVDLPDGSGFALARWMRATYPALRVLLAGTLAGTLQTAGQLCDELPLRKPYHHQSVLEHIRRMQAEHGQEQG